MLADPQSTTIGGTTSSLPRIEERATTHVYSNRANKVSLFVSQNRDDKKKVSRSAATLAQATTVVDPLTGLSSVAQPQVTVSWVLPDGVTETAVENLYDALTASLEASTKQMLKKLLGGEK